MLTAIPQALVVILAAFSPFAAFYAPPVLVLLALFAGPATAVAAMPTSPSDATPAAPAFVVSAELDTTTLVVGETYVARVLLDVIGEIHREFVWEDPRKPGELRRPLLQIQSPPSVELLGVAPANLVTPGDFQESYLRMPFGRRLLDKETEVAFRLIAEPQPGDVLGLNVVTYIESDTAEDATFTRLRIDLPLTSGARGIGVTTSNSRWAGEDTLAIGDTAPGFELKDARSGRLVSLESVLGEKRALVMAYRRST
jgi:hypothetical protein